MGKKKVETEKGTAIIIRNPFVTPGLQFFSRKDFIDGQPIFRKTMIKGKG